ncbi:MAG: hypothetical protein LBU83_08440 [Bacteroidales bacterium]|jgi:hypothetical protein|nr:hypothetical protein [Bacteroidales bacterium]
MIKIIYGVKDNSSDCELIFPSQDNSGLLNLVKQNIIKSDASEEIVGNSVYSIHCINNYYVFSKIVIVRDISKRVSYRAFMIALEQNERFLVLGEVEELEKLYTNSENIKQSTSYESRIKINSDTTPKPTVVVYYKDEKELKRYFEIHNNYKQHEAIYFINIEDKDKPENPINALKNGDNVISIERLHFSTNNQLDNNSTKNDEETGALKGTINQILKNRIVILIFGVLIGIAGGFWGYQKLPLCKTVENVAVEDTQDESNCEKNEQLDDEKEDIKEPEPKKEEAKKEEPKTEQKSARQLSTDQQNFLKEGCKTMTLSQINAKINTYSNWRNIKNLNGFANFVTLIVKNPPSKQEVESYIKTYNSNFDENDEYVKFVRYLEKQDDQFFDKNTKRISNIWDRTLKQIEQCYGYTQ